MANVSDDVIEAIANEYQDIRDMVTQNVVITRLAAPEGSVLLLQFDVTAPTHYLEAEGDKKPKDTNEITFWLDVKEGYPVTEPHVYYRPNFRLASANVFRKGAQCIDTWIFDAEHAGNNTSLVSVVRKTLKDIIHDPSVSNFKSPANRDMIEWQQKHINDKSFPTCKLCHLFKLEDGENSNIPPALPVKKSSKSTPPALPVR